MGAALVLTFLFGALGLFYASILGGLIMSFLFLLVIVMGVFTLGFAWILLAIIWPMTMVWGAVSASQQHRRFQIWQTHAGARRYPG